MEKKFYTDDFEQFLKETADEFRMYPSKRVWNSLYNNLHPGRKWPSLAVTLLLVSSLIFIGIAHKNEITGSERSVQADHAKKELLAKANNNSNLTNQLPQGISTNEIAGTRIVPTTISNGIVNRDETGIADHNSSITPKGTQSVDNNKNKIASQDPRNGKDKKTIRSTNGSTAIHASAVMAEEDAVAVDKKIGQAGLQKDLNAVTINSNQQDIDLTLAEKKTSSVAVPALPAAIKYNINAEKEWIEDFAFHNQAKPALKSKLQYQFYITPSVGFRTLKQTVSYNTTARPALVTTNIPDGLPALQQNAGFNFEAGFTYVYANSKSSHLKAGVQLNFTNYRTHLYDLGHPENTSLIIRDPFTSNGVQLEQRSTSLANLTGNANDKTVNNSTVQVSLPLGADIRFAGKHNLQWFVGATLQPTYVIFGNAYLISADHQNYVYDSKFLRKWNINAGVEAFVSYKTKKGVSFNAGPQFRYQFLSSYKSEYAFDEKLYNIGIKLGITRNF